MTNCWFWERKELFTWNKKHFASILIKCLSLKQTKTAILEGESPTLVLSTKEKVKWHKACKREVVLFLYKTNSWYVVLEILHEQLLGFYFFIACFFLHTEKEIEIEMERERLKDREWRMNVSWITNGINTQFLVPKYDPDLSPWYARFLFNWKSINSSLPLFIRRDLGTGQFVCRDKTFIYHICYENITKYLLWSQERDRSWTEQYARKKNVLNETNKEHSLKVSRTARKSKGKDLKI